MRLKEKNIRLKQLIRFLKERGAYKAWTRNITEDCRRDGRNLDEKMNSLNRLCNPLSCSFIYDKTPEGARFWCKLDNEFYDEFLQCKGKK